MFYEFGVITRGVGLKHKIELLQNVQLFFLDFLFKVTLIRPCFIEKHEKEFFRGAFSQNFSKFSKKSNFRLIIKNGKKNVTGQV